MDSDEACHFLRLRGNSMDMKLRQAGLFKLLGAVLFVSSLSGSICLGQASSTAAGQRQNALALEQAGNIEQAQAAWKSLLAAQPNSAEAYAHLGLLEARQDHYQEAIAHYRKALALDPRFPNLRLNLGLSLFKAGELKETIQTFEPMLKDLPPNSPQRLRLATLTGLAKYGVGNYLAAVPYLKEAAAGDPQNLQFKLMLAHSCLWSKQYHCVLDTYRDIIAINPDAAEAYMLAGEAYDELTDDTKALEQFQAAVKADPTLPNAHFAVGYLLWRLMRFDEATAAFRAELANNPEHALALAYLGDAEVHLQRSDEAQQHLEHSIRINPSFALTHLDLGTLYEAQGRKDDALREFELSAKLNPKDENVHWRLGRLYQSLGRKEEAKAELEKTRKLQKVRDEPLVEKINRVPEKRPLQNINSPQK